MGVSSDVVHPQSKYGSTHEHFWTETAILLAKKYQTEPFIHLVPNNATL